MKKASSLICLLVSIVLLISCHPRENRKPVQLEAESVILGFSQIGAESAWRNCNTQSVQSAAVENGIQLIFTNAEQKQENQIKAIRSFIAYQVDVIAFVPIVANGWDNVLQEAKIAGIPVLVTDRKINTADESLYAGFIGTDSEQEGRAAAEFLLRKFAPSTELKIVELYGTVGSSVADGRAKGFREVLQAYPGYKVIHSESGDFLRSKGYELMESILSRFSDFDAIFSHNDGMTLGALDALREHGIRPGKDIVIVTIDAEQAAIDALRAGEVNCVIECNPKTGPAIMELATRLASGGTIPRLLHVTEEVFTEDDDLSVILPRGY